MSNAVRHKAETLIRLLGEGDVFLAAAAEHALLLPAWRPVHPSIFILGLPRSGTTLVYQYVVHRLHVAYFPRAVGRYYRAPCLATALQKLRHPPYTSDFHSCYGNVAGPMAPHEAGRVWGRFFGLHTYVGPGDVSAWQRRILRRTLGCVQALFGGRPFVNKNVKHLLRIPALRALVPNAIFVRVDRSLSDVAVSLLRARYANLKDPTGWWSARPPNHAALEGRPLPEQIARQVYGLRAQLDADGAALPNDAVVSVDYEAFCAAPERLIERLRNVVPGLVPRSAQVPHFTASHNPPQTHEETQLVDCVEALDEAYPRGG